MMIKHLGCKLCKCYECIMNVGNLLNENSLLLLVVLLELQLKISTAVNILIGFLEHLG